MSTVKVNQCHQTLFVTLIHGYIPAGQKLNANQDLGVKVAAPVGTLVGQLLFGWLADVVGRKRMCKLQYDTLRHVNLTRLVFRWNRVDDYHHCHLRPSPFGWCPRSQHHRCSHSLEIHYGLVL